MSRLQPNLHRPLGMPVVPTMARAGRKTAMTRRLNQTARLYVPTLTAPDSPRHIIKHRDGPTLCGVELEGEQHAPQDWSRSALCPRCVQKYVREVFNLEPGEGWE